MPILRVASAHASAANAMVYQGRAKIYVYFWLLGKQRTFPKMGDSLPRMPMNRRAKFDAASFILAREIRNCTNAHMHTQKKQ